MSLATPSSIGNLPLPATSSRARRQLQHYLSAAAASGSRSASNNDRSRNRTMGDDAKTLITHAGRLSRQVDLLHSQVSESLSSSVPDETGTEADARQWWRAVTIQSDLQRLLSRIQGLARSATASANQRSLEEAASLTSQNIDIIASLLDLLSAPAQPNDSTDLGAGADAGPSSSSSTNRYFTAPLTVSGISTLTSYSSNHGYSYWKQKTLQGLEDLSDDDDEDAYDTDAFGSGATKSGQTESGWDLDEDDNVSEAESELTDPEIHLKPVRGHKADTGASVEAQVQDQDYSEYDQALSSRKRNQQETADQPDKSAAGATTSTSPGAETSDTILQGDRSTQEALSNELLRMASVLKSNSLAFADALERDRLLLEKAGDHLGSNLDLMTRTRGKLGIYSKKARSMGWFTLTSILVVMLSWMLMFLVIRLT
ncbi:hypothetical protein BCV70DRAFT_202382 [Testicularia cyperi]|uniref:t-SNARE coiled-coil homology domain-containing protein n=1 Tax=Testicularia cyperi TaxID=1882483 RepID=A0A317XHZ2_9BASI|nr:hypothetical protein BCV70DRAFT_202382 [Testicularia cyperi]